MERIPIEGSSNIASAGWEPTGPSMDIEFSRKGGGEGPVYRYDGVPEAKWRGFLASPSKGKYFAAEIKGHYLTTKVSG